LPIIINKAEKMKKKQLLKLLLILQKYANQGISLTELLVALVISSIVLTAATSGFVNLLTANRDVESKSVRSGTLSRALSYITEDIKEASSITQEAGGTICTSTDIDSNECLVLTYPAGSELETPGTACTETSPKIYYGYEDITTGSQIWLKPGILKRKVVCSSPSGGNWQVIADGLLSVNEDDTSASFANDTDFCAQDNINWTTGNLYGDNGSGKGGFRFCLNDTTATNRLVRIFLYGNIVGGNGNNVISVNTVSFARAD
jgi:prepilin-type N-terminal cleavage/methylation domain-containing protein